MLLNINKAVITMKKTKEMVRGIREILKDVIYICMYMTIIVTIIGGFFRWVFITLIA